MVFSCDAVVYGGDPFVETQVLADGVLVADGGADVFKGAADGELVFGAVDPTFSGDVEVESAVEPR